MIKLTIARRLSLGFGLLILMLLISVVLGLLRLDSVNDMMEQIISKDWKKTVLANEAIDLMNANARETFLLFYAADRNAVKQRIASNVQSRIERTPSQIEPPGHHSIAKVIQAPMCRATMRHGLAITPLNSRWTPTAWPSVPT